jgi:adenosine kinase
MTLDVLALGEPLIDIYHEAIASDELAKIGLKPGSWNLFDPHDTLSLDILKKIDEIPVLREVPGGSPGNFCFNMAMMGHEVGLVTALGDDRHGRIYHEHMRKYPITDLSQTIEGGRNAFLHALFTEGGERTFFSYTGCTPKIDLDGDYPSARYLYTSGFELAKIGRKVMDFISGYDAPLVFDPASPAVIHMNRQLFLEAMQYVRVLFVSPGEYQAIFGDCFCEDEPFWNLDGVEQIALKQGKDGSKVFFRDGSHYVPANDISQGDIVNTNGAGDSYAAGYMRGVLLGYEPKTAAKMGTGRAGISRRQEEPHLSDRI